MVGSWAEPPRTRNVGSSSGCSGVGDELDIGGKHQMTVDSRGSKCFRDLEQPVGNLQWDTGMLDHLQVLPGHLSLLYPTPGARSSLGKEPLPPAAPSPGFVSNLTAGFEMPAELRGAD